MRAYKKKPKDPSWTQIRNFQCYKENQELLFKFLKEINGYTKKTGNQFFKSIDCRSASCMSPKQRFPSKLQNFSMLSKEQQNQQCKFEVPNKKLNNSLINRRQAFSINTQKNLSDNLPLIQSMQNFSNSLARLPELISEGTFNVKRPRNLSLNTDIQKHKQNLRTDTDSSQKGQQLDVSSTISPTQSPTTKLIKFQGARIITQPNNNSNKDNYSSRRNTNTNAIDLNLLDRDEQEYNNVNTTQQIQYALPKRKKKIFWSEAQEIKLQKMKKQSSNQFRDDSNLLQSSSLQTKIQTCDTLKKSKHLQMGRQGRRNLRLIHQRIKENNADAYKQFGSLLNKLNVQLNRYQHRRAKSANTVIPSLVMHIKTTDENVQQDHFNKAGLLNSNQFQQIQTQQSNNIDKNRSDLYNIIINAQQDNDINLYKQQDSQVELISKQRENEINALMDNKLQFKLNKKQLREYSQQLKSKFPKEVRDKQYFCAFNKGLRDEELTCKQHLRSLVLRHKFMQIQHSEIQEEINDVVAKQERRQDKLERRKQGGGSKNYSKNEYLAQNSSDSDSDDESIHNNKETNKNLKGASIQRVVASYFSQKDQIGIGINSSACVQENMQQQKLQAKHTALQKQKLKFAQEYAQIMHQMQGDSKKPKRKKSVLKKIKEYQNKRRQPLLYKQANKNGEPATESADQYESYLKYKQKLELQLLEKNEQGLINLTDHENFEEQQINSLNRQINDYLNLEPANPQSKQLLQLIQTKSFNNQTLAQYSKSLSAQFQQLQNSMTHQERYAEKAQRFERRDQLTERMVRNGIIIRNNKQGGNKDAIINVQKLSKHVREGFALA